MRLTTAFAKRALAFAVAAVALPIVLRAPTLAVRGDAGGPLPDRLGLRRGDKRQRPRWRRQGSWWMRGGGGGITNFIKAETVKCGTGNYYYIGLCVDVDECSFW